MSHPFYRVARLALALAAAVLFTVHPAGASGPHQEAGAAVVGMYNWHTLASGQSVEWLFRYPGGDDPALIAFGTDPANSITISVYDDAQWRALGAGDWQIEPVGRGTSGTLNKWNENQDLIDSGNLFWEAAAGAAALFHIQLTNSSQGPGRYWIAEGGSAGGELTPYSALAAASPTSQPTLAAPSTVTSAQAPQPAGAGQSAFGTAVAQPLQPPQTLPITGAAGVILALAAGLMLVVAGWLLRRRAGEEFGNQPASANGETTSHRFWLVHQARIRSRASIRLKAV
jgi:LPXTG-motif cell wall-anchored protein